MRLRLWNWCHGVQPGGVQHRTRVSWAGRARWKGFSQIVGRLAADEGLARRQIGHTAAGSVGVPDHLVIQTHMAAWRCRAEEKRKDSANGWACSRTWRGCMATGHIARWAGGQSGQNKAAPPSTAAATAHRKQEQRGGISRRLVWPRGHEGRLSRARWLETGGQAEGAHGIAQKKVCLPKLLLQ